jgi:hypothetical protein
MFSIESLKSITLPQALLLIACLASLILAPKFLGEGDAERVVLAAGYILTFLAGRGAAPAATPPAPGKPELTLHKGGKSDNEE